MKNNIKALLLVTIFSTISPVLVAQEDQVIVIEDLSRAELRREIGLIEKEIYAMFNTNEENSDFHITCREILYTGTHIPEQSCEPQFLLDARSDNATDSQFGTTSLSTTAEIAAGQKSKFEQLTAAMDALGKENPNFAQLVMILNKLNARLAQL